MDKHRQAVKKHYDANTDKVLKRKVLARIKKGTIPQYTVMEKYGITLDEMNKIRESAGFEKVQKVNPPRKRSKPFRFTKDNVAEIYNELAKTNPGTAETHFKLLRDYLPDDVLNFYKNKEYLKILDSSTFITNKKTKTYNVNTATSIMAAMLNLLDRAEELKNKVGEDIYEDVKDSFNTLKIQKEQHNITKAQTETVEKFSDIIKRVEADNTLDSEEVLLVNLYDNITARNDFEDLSFDTTEPNHIDLDDGTITLREYKKTNKKYPAIVNVPLKKKVLNLLKKSHERNPRDKVFTKKIKSIFRKAKIGVDLLRHAKISEELAGSKIKDQAKREALRQKMLHSPLTQLSYVRKLKE